MKLRNSENGKCSQCGESWSNSTGKESLSTLQISGHLRLCSRHVSYIRRVQVTAASLTPANVPHFRIERTGCQLSGKK